jgi:hypothetical protein
MDDWPQRHTKNYITSRTSGGRTVKLHYRYETLYKGTESLGVASHTPEQVRLLLEG